MAIPEFQLNELLREEQCKDQQKTLNNFPAREDMELTPEQKRWASKRHQGVTPTRLRSILITQSGKCALSGVDMLFDIAEGTPQTDGRGCHPLYPAVDHIDPGHHSGGHQIVCYALNDLKGHLPLDCFDALSATAAWKTLMAKWQEQAARDRTDRNAFMRLLRPNANPKKVPKHTPDGICHPAVGLPKPSV